MRWDRACMGRPWGGRGARTRLLVAALGIAVSLGAGEVPTNSENPPVPREKYVALFQLMREGINDQYTFLSFTVWHNPPMTPRKLELVATSATRIQELAQKIPVVDFGRSDTYRFTHPREPWSDADQMILMAKAGQLGTAARTLQAAARRADEKGVQKALEELGDSCQSCHARFAKDLTFK